MQPSLTICYITDRKSSRPLEAFVSEAIEAGVDLIQIRERDLETRALLGIAERAVAASQGRASRVVINDRLDVALAAGAAGIHLGHQSISAQRVRCLAPRDFQVGVSCHSVAEVRAAEEADADYALLGPIFETPSKLAYGLPLGLEILRRAAEQARIPVLALGGVTVKRVRQCREAGAAGVAGIRIFQEAPSIGQRTQEIRQSWDDRRD
ncbi:MAG: thiamine phosphate synthase [Terriglobia bacterium]